jgi:hypothetical protein
MPRIGRHALVLQPQIVTWSPVPAYARLSVHVPARAWVKGGGHRWDFQAGKNEAGLDHYQVRLCTAWHRYVTLAMLALAWLAVTRARLAGDGERAISTANEIRRMFAALCGSPPDAQHARRWSRWRHRHQQRARHCHYQRQRLRDR